MCQLLFRTSTRHRCRPALAGSRLKKGELFQDSYKFCSSCFTTRCNFSVSHVKKKRPLPPAVVCCVTMKSFALFVFASSLWDHHQVVSFSPVKVIEPTRSISSTSSSSSSGRRRPRAAISPLRYAPITADEQDVLKRIQIPDGLRETLLGNLDTISKRYWIVDNSGSMAMHDGHHALEDADGNGDSCTRWNEVQEAVLCHAQLSSALAAPTEFRLLNAPKNLLGTGKKFRVGYCDTHNKRAMTRDLKRAESIMAKSKPSGMTSIPTAIAEVRNEIVSMLPQLEADNAKVAVVIATDGSNYSKDNVGNGSDEEQLQQEMITALESLHGLPVYVVIRLCTDFEPLVGFYNGLDSKLDLNLDVLDDYHHEAQEVYTHNSWLNYAMVLHRMREMGQEHELFDLLDERPFTKEEIRDFCILLFGPDAADPSIPDPTENWIGFISEIDCIQLRERMQLNPITHKHEPWLNIQKLAQVQKNK